MEKNSNSLFVWGESHSFLLSKSLINLSNIKSDALPSLPLTRTKPVSH